jgi:preprotein translocase subunit SecA
MGVLDRFFGDPNSKEIKKIDPIVLAINSKEASIQKLSDKKIKERYQEISSEVRGKIEKKPQKI